MPDHSGTALTLSLRAADGANAEIHRQGAHLLRWTAAGETRSRLFLSERAVFAPGVPIRGGVPVIFPQFAAEGPLLKHGFARIAMWDFQGHHSDAEGSEALFTLSDSAATRMHWPHTFLATLRVRIGSKRLRMQLEVLNQGEQPFQFTAALHSYLAVADIRAVTVEGLTGLHYRDTADGGSRKQEQAERLEIIGEVDRNYFDTPPALTLHDGARTLRIEQSGFTDTVVWNPGVSASAGFKDLAPNDYQRFLCIEAATIGKPVTLAAGARWQASQTLVA